MADKECHCAHPVGLKREDLDHADHPLLLAVPWQHKQHISQASMLDLTLLNHIDIASNMQVDK